MMKPQDTSNTHDDSLFGLLSVNKTHTTYVRVLLSEADDSIVVQLADNPAAWMINKDERLASHRVLRRLELGVSRSSVKYLLPEDIIGHMGPLLGLRAADGRIAVTATLKKTGLHAIETSLRYRVKVVAVVKKLLNLSPQKKYEILEKKFSDNQE